MIQMNFSVLDEFIELVNYITGRSEETKILRKLIEDLNTSAKNLSTAIRETNNGKSGS